MPDYCDAAGLRVQLDAVLGRGGEGTVYALAGDPARVAKIYHPSLAASRREKLEAMVALGNPHLLEFACWPQTLLYEARQHSFAGYVMSNLGECHAIHELYNPKSRRVIFPKASYKFLLHTATNIARAFAAANRSGIVIGDVNQNSIMVRTDGIVKLIDCDSAQVSAGGKLYRCEVGVPLFTPPELQGCEFSQVDRNDQHDAFGLAVLLFQLLCMGKHPFAGRYLRSGDMPIETAIAQRRFPYYQNGTSDFVPPPDSVDIRWLAPCADLFVSAFLGRIRPQPAQWIDGLGVLAKSLTSCSTNPSHQFPAAASKCPWCDIEAHTGAILFSITVVVRQGGILDIDVLWSRIGAISPPPPVATPSANVTFPPPTSEAKVLSKQKRTRRLISFAISVTIGGLLAVWQPALSLLIILFLTISERWASRVTAALTQQRESEFSAARQNIEEIRRKWREEASEALFVTRLRELEKIRDKAKQLPRIRATKLQELQSRMRESQLQSFLDRFHIISARIDGIGPGRAAKLSAFGIDTAADVTPTISVQGFGPVYKQRLLEWRAKLEAQFRFDPSRGVDRRDVDVIEQEFQRELGRCGGLLDGGPRVLSEIQSQITRRREALQQDYNVTLSRQVQAESDLKLLSSRNSYIGTLLIGIGLLAFILIWKTSFTPTPANNQPIAVPEPPDEAATLIANCGKPDLDTLTSKNTGIQNASRLLLYRHAGVKVVFNPVGSSGQKWKLEGFLDIKTLRPLSADKLATRFACASVLNKGTRPGQAQAGDDNQRRALVESKQLPAQPAAAPFARPTRIRILPEVMEKMLTVRVQPIYPQIAKNVRVQGPVVLSAIIGKDGTVQQLHVLSTASPLLSAAALDAVRQWHYRPYTVNGEPVEVDTKITINFTLSSGL